MSAALAADGRLAVTVHDMSHRVVPEIVGDTKKRLYAQTMFRAIRKRASVIFTVSSFSKDELRRHGQLTPEQYEAMLALRAFGTARGLTVGQLSERLQVKHHTAVTLVNKLVERGAASRTQGTSDRREVYVKLTPQGTDVLETTASVRSRSS